MRLDGTGEEGVAHGSLELKHLESFRARSLHTRLEEPDPASGTVGWQHTGERPSIHCRDFPEGGGSAFAVPNDGSFAIYRNVTRQVNILMLIEGFR